MLRETDLPCSDCGEALVERIVDARELAVVMPIDGTMTIAACPECGARYFPERSLSKLRAGSRRNEIGGGGG